MTTILRPTRGGEVTFPNQDRAIALAKERGDRFDDVSSGPLGFGGHLWEFAANIKLRYGMV